MKYPVPSFAIKYQNNCFNTELELIWYLFLGKLGIVKNNISYHPSIYKQGMHWHPDFQFTLKESCNTEFFASIKPLPASEFQSEPGVFDNMLVNSICCILGETNLDYLFTDVSQNISKVLEMAFMKNTSIWNSCKEKVFELSQKNNCMPVLESDSKRIMQRLPFGKYKGFSLPQIREKNIAYYNWIIETYN